MRRMGLGGWTVLGLAAVYFIVPLVMTVVFSLWEGQGHYGLASYRSLLARPNLVPSLVVSLELAAATCAAIVFVLAPAMIFMNLYAPRLRPVFEFIAALPFVVPAIALVGGLSALFTADRGFTWLIGTPFYLTVPYFLLALPYAYRAIDVGIRSLDLTTLTEAGQSLGASLGQIIRMVVLPNLQSALIGSMLLTFAVVMGEFTFANVLLFHTFAVLINEVGQNAPTEAAALSTLSFVITWGAMLAVLVVGRGNAQLGGAR
jgi:putative spermidine/putrescine transport system permease protein